jgi:hypothetical protein
MPMPIAHLLAAREFTPEQRHVIELAFNHALRKLKLADRNDPFCEIVAQKVIEVAAGGHMSAARLESSLIGNSRRTSKARPFLAQPDSAVACFGNDPSGFCAS